jgi:hypothetical protein
MLNRKLSPSFTVGEKHRRRSSAAPPAAQQAPRRATPDKGNIRSYHADDPPPLTHEQQITLALPNLRRKVMANDETKARGIVRNEMEQATINTKTEVIQQIPTPDNAYYDIFAFYVPKGLASQAVRAALAWLYPAPWRRGIRDNSLMARLTRRCKAGSGRWRKKNMDD